MGKLFYFINQMKFTVLALLDVALAQNYSNGLAGCNQSCKGKHGRALINCFDYCRRYFRREEEDIEDLIELYGACQINEAHNRLGPNRCSHSGECHGRRYCSGYGWCHGEAECSGTDDNTTDGNLEELAGTNSCAIDESLSRYGANKCKENSDCSGRRTCSSSGWCQGRSECPEGCTIDESLHPLGENRCDDHDDCSGERTCSGFGWCQGRSGCDPDDDDTS